MDIWIYSDIFGIIWIYYIWISYWLSYDLILDIENGYCQFHCDNFAIIMKARIVVKGIINVILSSWDDDHPNRLCIGSNSNMITWTWKNQLIKLGAMCRSCGGEQLAKYKLYASMFVKG